LSQKNENDRERRVNSSRRESSGFYRACVELLRSANPKEYFLDNHNAIPSCYFSYITNTPSCSLRPSCERSLHPRGDDQEASYVLDIFNVFQRFQRISRATNVSTLCPRAPAWPFSPRTESIPMACGIYFVSSRACARANMKRSKMNG